MTDSALFTAGTLLNTDYLCDAIRQAPAYLEVDVAALRSRLISIAEAFPQAWSTNESQTEDDFIWPVLSALGWTESIRQQNLTVSGRDDVPDGLLFASAEAKAAANALGEQWKRYGHGQQLSKASAGLVRWIVLPGGMKQPRRLRRCSATCAGLMI